MADIGEKFTESLRCELTEWEVADRAANMARSVFAREEAEIERELANKAAKEVIKALDARVSSLAREVRERAVYRLVDCVEQRNEIESMIETIRLDTSEIVRARPMTAEEKQLGLFPKQVDVEA
jgi:hypothetical protein